jgi:nicotinamide-nucleotide amidase
MKAATLSIGDELAMGQIDDSNARWIATRLAAEGLFRAEHRTVGDDLDRLAAAIGELACDHDLLILTGGLGPTKDDLTRDALHRHCDPDGPLVEDPAARAALERWFRGRSRAMPASNLVQALRPRSARCLPNPHGTAPGLAARVGRALVFCLPGPPREMQPMFEAEVLPEVRALAGSVAMPTLAIHSFGMGESGLAERLGERMQRDRDPMVGTTASQSIVTARIRSQGERSEAIARVEAMGGEIERLWFPYAYGRNGATLAEALVALLRERGQTLALAESCTGGLIGAMVTEVAGASEVLLGGFVAYSNEWKVREVGVDRSTLAAHGAVSEPVARQLAAGAREQARSTWGIGVTGIAGPGGGTAAKPVGTVFIGLAGPDGERVRRFQFPGDRETVRDRSAKAAIQWLRCAVLGQPDIPILWSFAEAPAAERLAGPSA